MRNSEVTPKSYLRLLRLPAAFLLLSFAATVFFAKSIERRSLPRVTGVFVKLRMKEMLENLPALAAADAPFAFFWGASEIESGLETRVLDEVFREHGLEWRSVNLGMRSVQPLAYRAFAERVVRGLEGSSRKIEVSFIKLPTGKLTKIYHRNYPDSGVYDEIGQVLDFSDWKFARTRPLAYAHAAVNHYLLGDATLGLVHDFFRSQLESWVPQPESRRIDIYFRVWQDPAFLEASLWNPAARGAYRWNLPQSAEDFEAAVAAKQERAVQLSSYYHFERCCGLNSLDFDEQLVDDFVAMVKSVSRVSKKVYLYQIPESGDYNIWRRNFYQRRVQDILDRIDDRVDVELVDMTDANVPDAGYLDFLHLNEEGQKKFYTLMLDRITSARSRGSATSGP